MKITRDVITDLLPVYLAGEASPDTRVIIEEFLKENPDFAKLVAEQEMPLTPNSINIPKETEMQTLEKTKKLLWQRSLYLGFAIFFTLFTFSFRFNAQGVYWFWTDTPIVAVTCLIVGIMMWVKYAKTNQRLQGSGI
jgi:hypothetical protein